MTNVWSRSFLLTALVTACSAESVSAANPFDGVNWGQLLAHDPSLYPDPNIESSAHKKAYAAKEGRGLYDGFRGRKAVVGRAGGEWVAAVPLESGGEIGLSGWLLYLPHDPKHISIVGGSESLRFIKSKIVTVTEEGGRSRGHGVELTYSVHGKTVELVRKRAVLLDSEDETLQ